MRSAGQKKCLARELDHVTKPWPKAYDLSCEMLIKKSASENMRVQPCKEVEIESIKKVLLMMRVG